MAPLIQDTTAEEREAYIKQRHPCIADCDMCGFCAAFRGQAAEVVFADYIAGLREYQDIASEYRRV
ncbi:MAG: hypothetical protein SPK77_03685 [Lachnospiraceae bacterium]|nr:hypothetical protein [Lachnospiraceae bacterium]MDY5704039.1 hypothetical protein [Lachnospiraceae bacterium]